VPDRLPAFVIATDLEAGEPSWPAAEAQVVQIREESARILGFEPQVTLAAPPWCTFPSVPEVFVLPAPLEFSLLQREALGRALTETRRERPEITIHHDDVDPGHPLVVAALADCQSAAGFQPAPPQRGLILAPSGCGDPAGRAQSYRLMRLLWEELGVRKAEVGFVRHVQPFLAHVLERCLEARLPWVILAQSQWETEHVAYARVMLENLQRSHPEAADWAFVDPPGAHPALTSWYVQRIVRLWQQKRERESVRIRSAKSAEPSPAIWHAGNGVIAQVPDRDAMAETLSRILPPGKPERVLVKVTLHGYATGTYTDPAALDLLLSALPAPAIILEGHTSSRNLTAPDFDWETEARENRAWIRQQDAEYLRRTGLTGVLARHNAQYVNVTEAFWDGECACRCEVEREVQLGHPELADFMPQVLLQFRGCPLISFAKVKGATRLGISNLFGLIPDPLRSRWHGPNIIWFARVCCDIAKLYGAFFGLYGVVEGLFTAVRWNRQGIYRSRWGNYDLIQNAGIVTASRGLVSADILASRMQGQDVLRSAFFDVVREDLAWDSGAAEAQLPESLVTVFA
jgi:sirohydrochlorin ferrochelatase